MGNQASSHLHIKQSTSGRHLYHLITIFGEVSTVIISAG